MNMERPRDFSDLRQAPSGSGRDGSTWSSGQRADRATEEHAAEMVARAEAAAAHLQEEMRLAERVLEAAETRRRSPKAREELKTRLDEVDKDYRSASTR